MPGVGINAVVLTPQSGGLLVYVQNLIDQLLLLETDLQFKLFFSHNFLKQVPRYAALENSVGLALSGENPKKRILLEPFVWPSVTKKNHLDLFHSPISYIPSGVKIPAVVTIHDLGFFHFPEFYPKLKVKFLHRMIARAARNAVKIIAISEFTQKDIVEYFGIPESKITCIYQGFSPDRFQNPGSEEGIAQIRQKYRLPEKYILSVGHLEPRKNFNRLIQAFFQLKQQEKIPHKLVIVGRENWLFASFYELLEKLQLKEDVRFTGFVAHEDLPALYQLAELFVLPTLFEGFGFPVLESMAAGTPVVCSNCTSLPEVGHDAACYFNPYKIDEITDQMLKVLKHENLKAELIHKGFENLKRFTWSNCARQTLETYQEGLTNNG